MSVKMRVKARVKARVMTYLRLRRVVNVME